MLQTVRNGENGQVQRGSKLFVSSANTEWTTPMNEQQQSTWAQLPQDWPTGSRSIRSACLFLEFPLKSIHIKLWNSLLTSSWCILLLLSPGSMKRWIVGPRQPNNKHFESSLTILRLKQPCQNDDPEPYFDENSWRWPSKYRWNRLQPRDWAPRRTIRWSLSDLSVF